MRILLFGSKDDYQKTVDCQDMVSELQYRRIECTHAPDFDRFLEKMQQTDYDIIVVTANGAEGMEGVIAAQKLFPDGHVVWFSDDAGFGIQACRLGCTYFAVKPITHELVSKAYRAFQRI